MYRVFLDSIGLKAASFQLGTHISRYRTFNKNLENLISNIDESWDGEAAESYIRMMNKYKNQSEELVETLEEFRKYVDNAQVKFAEKDRQIASRIRGSF